MEFPLFDSEKRTKKKDEITSRPLLRVAFPLLLIFVTTASGQTKPPLSTTTAPQPQQTATAKIKVVFNAAPSSSNSAVPSLTVNSAPLGTTVQSNVMAAPPIQLQAVPAISTSCSNGNCGSSSQIVAVPSTGCTSGNCNNNAPIVVSAPSYSNGCYNGNCNNNYNTAPIVIQSTSNGCSYGNCNNNAPIVIQSSSNGCYGSNCGWGQPIVIPSFNNGCYGSGCGGYNNYSPLLTTILGSGCGSSGCGGYGCGSSGCSGYGCGSTGCRGSTTNTFSSFGVPDPITTNGNFFRPKVRIPMRYDNGNPVFSLRGGYSSYGFGRK